MPVLAAASPTRFVTVTIPFPVGMGSIVAFSAPSPHRPGRAACGRADAPPRGHCQAQPFAPKIGKGAN